MKVLFNDVDDFLAELELLYPPSVRSNHSVRLCILRDPAGLAGLYMLRTIAGIRCGDELIELIATCGEAMAGAGSEQASVKRSMEVRDLVRKQAEKLEYQVRGGRYMPE